MKSLASIARAALNCLAIDNNNEKSFTQVTDVRVVAVVGSTSFYVVTGVCFRNVSSYERHCIVKAADDDIHAAEVLAGGARGAEAQCYMLADDERTAMLDLH